MRTRNTVALAIIAGFGLGAATVAVIHAQAKPPVLVIPLPSATSDYLLAHQGFSPRMSFQGMAPYVRTVSGEVQGAHR